MQTTKEEIARVCHEVNRAYCQALGDMSQPAWEDAPMWQRDSARLGVELHLSGDHGPEASHESWAAQKIADGWKYGPVKTKYNGPMLALKTARKAYVKAANGIQCNGDDLAIMCGQYPRETVVKGLIQALGLPGNPYLSLNPGQQSMNLRNKARHALKAGLVTSDHVALCLKAAAGK